MNLETHYRSQFDSQARARGDDYFSRDSVDIELIDDDGVTAFVDNERDDVYEVSISFANDGRRLEGSCTCPRFANGFLCKHMWATILEVDWVRDEESDESSDFIELGFDSEGNSFGLSLTASQKFHDLKSKLLGAITENTSNPQPHQTDSRPAWQLKLEDVRRTVNHRSESFDGLSQPTDLDVQEIWYVLDLAASVQRSRPIILFRQRERKADGNWGKIKPLSVDADSVFKVRSLEHREMIAHLLEFRDSSDQHRYSYSWQNSKTDRSLPTTVAFRAVVPALCQTGRFVLCLSADQSPEDGTTLQSDNGPVWRFRVNVDDDSETKSWRVFGEIFRETESVDLSEVVLVFEDGLVILNDRICRFQAEDSFVWLHTLLQSGGLQVPWDAREKLLSELAAIGGVDFDRLPENLRPRNICSEAKPFFRILRDEEVDSRFPKGNLFFANISYAYDDLKIDAGESAMGVFCADSDSLLLRDREMETRRLSELVDLKVAIAGSVEWRCDGAQHQFKRTRLPEITNRLVELGWSVEAQGRLIRKSSGTFNVSVSSGIDWFDLNAEFDFDGEIARLPALLQAVRSGDSYVKLDDGTYGMLPAEWLKKYGRIMELGKGTEDGVRFRAPQALLLDSLLADQSQMNVDRKFRDTCNRLKKFEGVKPKNAPATFNGELRDYQKQGLGWLNFLREFRLGGCLADEMGLGKTIQILSLLEMRRKRRLKKDEVRRPSLVVVPKSLVFNWIDEAERFTPKLRVLNYTGLERKDHRDRFDDHHVIITTYGTLRQDILVLKDHQFDYVILDEAQAIKNSESQAAKAARVLIAEHRLALTGTPVENHMGELWSLFEFLNPGMLGRSSSFRKLTKGDVDEEGIRFVASGLRPFLLRRTKEQVLSELPEKTEQTLYCEMLPKQRKVYDELRDYYRNSLSDRIKAVGIKKAKIHVLEALLRLRQAACHPALIDRSREKDSSAKLEMLLEQIDEIVAEGRKTLVFSQFTSLLSIVRNQLDKQGVTYEYLDGKTTKRKEKVERFQTNPDCSLFLISLKAGGQGLNLTAAEYVFILDPWWNPAVEAQAIDRAHRIGQTQNVFAYRLICRDTVEERIIELQKEKQKLANAIINADNSLISKLTTDDLQLLLS